MNEIAEKIAKNIINSYSIQIDQGMHRDWRWADDRDIKGMGEIIDETLSEVTDALESALETSEWIGNEEACIKATKILKMLKNEK